MAPRKLEAGGQPEQAEPGSGKNEEGGPKAGEADSSGLVVSKDVADAVKEGSSVTQSTLVNQVNMAPNIAEGDLSKGQDTQRDDAVPAIPSSGRSPQASVQSPAGLGTEAAA